VLVLVLRVGGDNAGACLRRVCDVCACNPHILTMQLDLRIIYLGWVIHHSIIYDRPYLPICEQLLALPQLGVGSRRKSYAPADVCLK
jgi:hypothetical protein